MTARASPSRNGHAADLWTAFELADGVEALGYPVSRRFEWDGFVAQAFSKQIVLRWNPDSEQADALTIDDLPDGRPPAYAVVPEQPPLTSGEVQPTPWSGWWWPASGYGPALFAPNGPLDKYDRFVATMTGDDPGTRAWER
jgi:hypothetical protein